MATAVRAKRSLWARRPLHGDPPHVSAAQLLHALEHGVGGGRDELVHDLAVGQEHHPVGVGGGPGSWVTITMDWSESVTERRRKASISAEAFESRLPVGSSAKIEVGPSDQGPGAGDPLLLAAGHLVRPVRQAVGDAQLAHQLIEPGPVDVGAGQIGREGDVLPRGERGDQVERLEHEADPVPPQSGETGVVQQADLLVTDEGPSRRRRRRGPPCSASASTSPSPRVP